MQIDEAQLETVLLGLFLQRPDYRDNHDACRLY